mmetsp:Transcript_20138/g.30861  ORF Transcript_20138/g.30861 Transcript_20138/m.30861 type:complete len:274 (-) Transcript_20138:142-963(-)|eukprot:CAMPEP_0196804672 /NCGR_PEP_ID=MMETSP1362-20130617/4333_1 /TAXON_ID=163516 /ORGANISM="Leptocylindrus danicus, Strain CCMP1856" /LENGTH=273 /DNA_ID=CAMNT_0042177129 /DNA_START=221 /DNA_END=1042 /DNA_ORIENTATION=-
MPSYDNDFYHSTVLISEQREAAAESICDMISLEKEPYRAPSSSEDFASNVVYINYVTRLREASRAIIESTLRDCPVLASIDHADFVAIALNNLDRFAATYSLEAGQRAIDQRKWSLIVYAVIQFAAETCSGGKVQVGLEAFDQMFGKAVPTMHEISNMKLEILMALHFKVNPPTCGEFCQLLYPFVISAVHEESSSQHSASISEEIVRDAIKFSEEASCYDVRFMGQKQSNIAFSCMAHAIQQNKCTSTKGNALQKFQMEVREALGLAGDAHP